MSIGRRTFLTGAGVFAAASAFGLPRASAQLVPQTQSFDLGDQGVLYRVDLNAGAGGWVRCTAAVLPRRSFAADVVVHERANALAAVRDVARKTGAVVAINGGRFNGAFAPDGLLIVDGKQLGRKRADWTGYLTIDASGNAAVTNDPDLRFARSAVQGEPLLIEPGGKMGIARDDGRRFRRTVIAQSGDVAIAMVTSPVSLFTLAYVLLERPDAFYLNHIDAALNLSGAATASLYAKLPDGDTVEIPASWPNLDVVTFTPRAV